MSCEGCKRFGEVKGVPAGQRDQPENKEEVSTPLPLFARRFKG